ncbi:MAG: HAD-IB family phosphatase [Gemmatimonadaceae bacterium]|nr:HAD-IB family phosphatase [Gemmatimonadaceae bacterium]
MTAFKSVVLDVDSTVSALEGIDWLAERRDATVAATVAALTADAMESRVPLDEVYGRRLRIIRPTRSEIAELGAIYIASALPGVRDAVRSWIAADVRVVLVSGGLRDAILPLAAWLGIVADDVFAVEVEFDDADVASDVRADSPLARRGGKPEVVSSLALARPTLAVGDGATDAELVSVVDRFLAFTGVARRASVVARAAGEVDSFAALTPIVLGL